MGDYKTKSFGGCSYGKLSPKRKDLTATTDTLNMHIPFEEALKLNLALDECIRKLNQYKMSSKTGKRAAVNIAVRFNLGRIVIVEGKV